MRLDSGGLDEHALDAEVGELRLVDVVLLVERDRDPVDDAVSAALPDRGLHQLGLVPVHVVVGENLAHCVDPSLDRRLVVGCGVLAEQVLQHVRGHDRVALDRLHEVLRTTTPGKS